MKRECKQSRDRLLAGGAAGDHLGSCEECARFASRLEGFRSGLAGRHAEVVPDAGFAARVRGGLPRAEADPLGWAIWRLLPVAVALVLVLAIWSYRTPLPLEMSADTDEDLLAWVIGDETELP